MHKALWLHKFIFFHFLEVTFQTKPKKIEMCCLFSFPYQHQFQILTRNKKKHNQGHDSVYYKDTRSKK